MSIFNQIAHAFQPVKHVVEQAGHEFDPQHVADLLKQAIVTPIKSRIDGHAIIHEVVEGLKLAEPSAVDIDLFASIGVELGVELELEFDMGITVEQPRQHIEALAQIINNPPATVHQLCDRLWGIVPTEVRTYERFQVVFGGQVQERWYGEDVMQRVVNFLDKEGLLEKSLRP